jgi:hypothetical protein
MVQCLAEECQVDGFGVYREVFQIAPAVFQVGDTVLRGHHLAILHHLLGVIDGDHLLGAQGQELGKRAFAGAQVRDYHARHQAQQHLGQALPGAPGNILAAELARHFVEVAAHFVFALAEDQFQRVGVLLSFGNLSSSQEFQKWVQGFPVLQLVENVLADAAVFHQTGGLQLGEVGGNLALAFGQNLLQFGDGKLFLLEQQHDPHPCGIGQQAERF